MRTVIVGISVAALMTASGFAETIITAQDYAVDSDVVLESAVREIKSIPADTAAVVGDVVKFAVDETVIAAEGIASLFKEDIHAQVQIDGELAVEDAWETDDTISFRSYKVSDIMGDLLQAYAEDKSATAVDVTDFFNGIEFPERTSIRYLPEFNSLFVKQTMPNLIAIEDVLASYQREQKNLMGKQVEIEAKFIEVNQSAMNEMGFDWTFTGADGGALSLIDDLVLPNYDIFPFAEPASGTPPYPLDFYPVGQKVFSEGLRGASAALGGAPTAGTLSLVGNAGSIGFKLLINALEQSDDSDVLCAPRLVTQDGEEAVIEVGEDRMLPKEFEIGSQESNPFVQHEGWELELMGAKMEVTPDIRNDGLIDLEINARIFDIIGYDSYTVAAWSQDNQKNPEFNPAGRPDVDYRNGTPELYASLPYMQIRKLETRVTVADGSTIGMGGLIYDKLETFRDKVPVLGSIPWIGRLFRSEGERSVKRNLMIFVTATQVDTKGRRAADLVLKK